MNSKVFKVIIFVFAALIFISFFISTAFRRSSDNSRNQNFKPEISTSTINLPINQKISTSSEKVISATEQKPKLNSSSATAAKPQIPPTAMVKEVSSKSFEELINSSIIQIYCGYLNNDKTSFSDISRGTGIIINEKGEILTNRHIIYNENLKKTRSDCFILKSPFPNSKSEKPKIYYMAEIIAYPDLEKFSEEFSKDKYYNDFAVLKIISKIDKESKINLLLGFDYASENDYLVLSPYANIFNYLPIDWNYQPQNSDSLITLGYGVDAAHFANQITSTIGKLAGNIDINKSFKPQVLLIESNATAGFSGGALINPRSKGLIGLISWITSGDVTGKYTVAIFRDFLTEMMLGELDFNLKAL